jgi:hypothetical protein
MQFALTGTQEQRELKNRLTAAAAEAAVSLRGLNWTIQGGGESMLTMLCDSHGKTIWAHAGHPEADVLDFKGWLKEKPATVAVQQGYRPFKLF